eukprot:CCRYP_009145-RB/>CCRYP_009145-RB protein AED:0.43 eAED:0.43 QI:0/0/0/1/0/0/2/0/158
MHRHNISEHGIQMFKGYFISILAGAADNFPINQWHELSYLEFALTVECNSQYIGVGISLITIKCRWCPWDVKFTSTSDLAGNIINYQDDVGTPTANLLLIKIFLNSVISKKGVRLISGANISNFYLRTPLKCLEYSTICLSDIHEEVIKDYNLHQYMR